MLEYGAESGAVAADRRRREKAALSEIARRLDVRAMPPSRDRARDDAAGGDDSDDDELLRSVDDETIEAYASRACGQLRRGGADPADRAPGASVSSLEAPAEVAERALTGAVLGLVASEPQLTAQQHFDREFAAARAAARKAVQEAAAREAAARAPVPVRARGARALTGNERRERLWKG